MDQIDGWSVGDSDDDDLSCYGEDNAKASALMTAPPATGVGPASTKNVKKHQRRPSEMVTINVDNRKSSTGSQVRSRQGLQVQ